MIGESGYGFERLADGTLLRFPHHGGVVIEDDVEIGANTCIDRGTIEDTWIGTGTKVDNLVHIAHNVHIGPHAARYRAAEFAAAATLAPARGSLRPPACARACVSATTRRSGSARW